MIKSPVALVASYVYMQIYYSGKQKEWQARQQHCSMRIYLGRNTIQHSAVLCAYNVQTYDRKNGIVKPSMFSTHHLMVRSTPTPATKAAAYSMASSKPNSSSRRTNA